MQNLEHLLIMREITVWLYGRDYEFSIFALSLCMAYKAVTHSLGKTRRELKLIYLCVIIPTLGNEFLKGNSPWERRPAHNFSVLAQSTTSFPKSLHMWSPFIRNTIKEIVQHVLLLLYFLYLSGRSQMLNFTYFSGSEGKRYTRTGYSIQSHEIYEIEGFL